MPGESWEFGGENDGMWWKYHVIPLYLPIPLGLPLMLCPPFFDLQIQLAICYGYNILQSPQTQLDCWSASAPLDPSDQAAVSNHGLDSNNHQSNHVEASACLFQYFPVYSSMKLWYLYGLYVSIPLLCNSYLSLSQNNESLDESTGLRSSISGADVPYIRCRLGAQNALCARSAWTSPYSQNPREDIKILKVHEKNDDNHGILWYRNLWKRTS